MAEDSTLESAIEKNLSFPPWILNTGFITALVLAFICLAIGGYYLHRFQEVTQSAIVNVINGKPIAQEGVFHLALIGQMYLARIQLLSCGIFVGMSFGFLGFALFLLGVKGQMEAEGKGASLTFKVLSISPGVFVILCSTILIGLCATRDLPFNYNQAGKKEKQTSNSTIKQQKGAAPPSPEPLPKDSTQSN